MYLVALQDDFGIVEASAAVFHMRVGVGFVRCVVAAWKV
jgi:hypothetical protein